MTDEHHGVNRRRLDANPEEEMFADAWEQRHRDDPNCLGWILDAKQSGSYPPRPSDRDRQVAASVIQWLGSPVGQGFVAEAIGSEGLAEMAKVQAANEKHARDWKARRP